MNNSTDIRVIRLFKTYEKTGSYDVNELFYLHNIIFSIKEYNKKCSRCVNRTFKNVKRHYLKIR